MEATQLQSACTLLSRKTDGLLVPPEFTVVVVPVCVQVQRSTRSKNAGVAVRSTLSPASTMQPLAGQALPVDTILAVAPAPSIARSATNVTVLTGTKLAVQLRWLVTAGIFSTGLV